MVSAKNLSHLARKLSFSVFRFVVDAAEGYDFPIPAITPPMMILARTAAERMASTREIIGWFERMVKFSSFQGSPDAAVDFVVRSVCD